MFWGYLEISCWPPQSVVVFSPVRLFVTPTTVACQAGLSMEFSRQEYWSGLSFPPPEDLPSSGIKRTSPELAGGFFTVGTPCVGDIATSFLLGALGRRPLCEQPLLGPPCGWGCPAPSCRILTPDVTALMAGLEIKEGVSSQSLKALWVEGKQGGRAQTLPVTFLTKACLAFLPRARRTAPSYHPWDSQILCLLCFRDLVQTLVFINQS